MARGLCVVWPINWSPEIHFALKLRAPGQYVESTYTASFCAPQSKVAHASECSYNSYTHECACESVS